MDEKVEPAETSGMVSREILRQVIRQRQELKRELKSLKEQLKELPEDWPERIKAWRELEARAGALASGELIKAKEYEAEKADWQSRERNYQQRIGQLALAERIRKTAARSAAYDPDDVVALMRGFFNVETEGDQVRIGLKPNVEQAGLEMFNDDGEEQTLEEVVAQFLKKKPHLVRAQTLSGSGSRPELIKPTPATPLGPADQARAMLAERLRLQGRLA